MDRRLGAVSLLPAATVVAYSVGFILSEINLANSIEKVNMEPSFWTGIALMSQHVLKKLAQSLHVNPIFTGQLDEVTLIQAYSAADVVVVPSRTEAFAIVLLEAMACGKPIVAARVGAIPEIVDDSNSILTGPEDPHELASAVKKLLLDETLRARLGEAGKRMVYKYSWDTVVRKIEQVYRSAIQHSRESS